MKIGFLVNPIAGMGGKVALKGTDGEETLRRALALGASPVAPLRAAEAVRFFAPYSEGHLFFSPSGSMGGEILRAYGISPQILFDPPERTTASETRRAVEMMLELEVEMLVFAGGDGTARDVCGMIDEKVPAIGIPCGVKIHSGVYAKTPKDAGKLVSLVLRGEVRRFVEKEVLDVDEGAFRKDVVRVRLYGYMRVPDERKFMQDRKSGSTLSDGEDREALAAYVASLMHPEGLYLIGPGSTTMCLKRRLKIEGTLLGIDAVKGGRGIGKDLNESQIRELLSSEERKNRFLVLTIIGGQGFLFGRGNQQLSPEVIRMVPKENLWVMATPSKMASLFGQSLVVDTGDPLLDEEMKGYLPVIIGYGKRLMAKIS